MRHPLLTFLVFPIIVGVVLLIVGLLLPSKESKLVVSSSDNEVIEELKNAISDISKSMAVLSSEKDEKIAELNNRLQALVIEFNSRRSSVKKSTNDDKIVINKELRCLALNVYFLSRGEQTITQLAIAMLTMNRVHSDEFPNSVCEVVWQKQQFVWTSDGESDQPIVEEDWRMASQVARFVFNKYAEHNLRTKGALDLTKGALYFTRGSEKPYFPENFSATTQISDFLFYK